MNIYNILILLFSVCIQCYAYAQDTLMVKEVIHALNLEHKDVKHELVSVKPYFDSSDEYIVIIPEIVYEGEYAFDFTLNTNIVIFNSQTKQIKYRYFEGSSTNNWTSDAIKLQEISIDLKFYSVGTDKSAFGVTVNYVGSSRANPYALETISLFSINQDSLQCVLDKFSLSLESGAWDMACERRQENIKNTIIKTNEIINDHYVLEVMQSKISEYNYLDSNGDCQFTESKLLNETFKLVYKDGEFRQAN